MSWPITTERAALDRLESLGAEIKVAYESKTTRLHAKAWLFHRKSGFSTAYIGSSNMSKSALLDGLEWNVRLSQIESPHLLEKFRATFESYWEAQLFESYERAHDAERFDLQIKGERQIMPETKLVAFDIRPYPYQREMLERLRAERELHGRYRNLVVAATGTGKTVLAALDYKRLSAKDDLSLLFVAHRKEILQQSLITFRQVLGDGTFGEMLVAGQRPKRWQHVFGSIQTLTRLDEISERHFDVVIIDEFHHAGATTYRKLLERLKPKYLLGLTATPERADGIDVLAWFDGRMAVELRLWDALDQQLLCPFQYFGVHDNTDLRAVDWRNGRYAVDQLDNLYTGDHARVNLVLKQLKKKIVDVRSMRAIGFCVTQRHARFMAEQFNRAGIPSAAVLGYTDHEERDLALKKLKRRELNVLFAVDIYNEGVDVPAVDTLLMLRPTNSATVFLQQLGRGLRLADDKPCCTVLDFIGLQNRRFRFDLKYRALTGTSRKKLIDGVTNGFPHLPAGCHIQLDSVAQQIVLDSIRAAVPSNVRQLVAELRRLGAQTELSDFLEKTALEPEDLYRSKRSFADLRRRAGYDKAPTVDDTKLLARFETLLHIDDPERVNFYLDCLAAHVAPNVETAGDRRVRQLTMLHYSLRGHTKEWRQLQASLNDIWSKPAVKAELRALLVVLRERAKHVTHSLGLLKPIPLRVHARYTRDEIRAAIGDLRAEKPSSHQTGVHWSAVNKLDVFFVTLNKSAAHFSPSTQYRDYPISDRLFHWESQSATSTQSPTGRRYVSQGNGDTDVLLCVREVGKDSRGVAVPFVCLGLADHVRHEGSRPIALTWRLRTPMPAAFYERAKAVAG